MNELSSYQFLQCHEIPVYVCYDSLKTLASTSNPYAYDYYITHPSAVFSGVFIGGENYDSRHLVDPIIRNTPFDFKPSAMWNSVMSITGVCQAMYERAEAAASGFQREVVFSGLTPSIPYNFPSYPGGSEFMLTLTRNVWRDVIKYSTFYGLISYNLLSSCIHRLGIENLRFQPNLDVGEFSWELSNSTITMAGNQKPRWKTGYFYAKTYDGLTGVIASPILGLSQNTTTQPPWDSNWSFGTNGRYTAEIEGNLSETNASYLNSLAGGRFQMPIYDPMPSIFRWSSDNTVVHLEANGIDELKQGILPAIIHAIRYFNTGSDDMVNMGILLTYFSDLIIQRADPGPNIISGSVIDKDGTFNRGYWGIHSIHMCRALSEILKEHIEGYRAETLTYNGRGFYIINAIHPKTRDLYQHKVTLVRCNYNNDVNLGGLFIDGEFFVGYKVIIGPTKPYEVTYEISEKMKDWFLKSII